MDRFIHFSIIKGMEMVFLLRFDSFFFPLFLFFTRGEMLDCSFHEFKSSSFRCPV